MHFILYLTLVTGLDKETYLLLMVNFSSRTTSLDVQRNLEANVEKRTKDTFGPPPGKRLLIFIDDMNMPQVSKKITLKFTIAATE